MKISFRGICSGTETKKSLKSGKDYQITKFVELPSMKVLEVFGDLGLPVSETPVQWDLEGEVTAVRSVKVIAGGKAK